MPNKVVRLWPWFIILVCPAICLAQIDHDPTRGFWKLGLDQTTAIAVHPKIHLAVGFSNSFLVTTDEGNIVVDTSWGGNSRHIHRLLSQANPGPVRFVVLTHAHPDHTGGVAPWKAAGAEIITHPYFPEMAASQSRLSEFFSLRNAAQFGFHRFGSNLVGRLTGHAGSGGSEQAGGGNAIIPDRLVDDEESLEFGGVRVVFLHTPGETPDHLSIWIPEYRAVFVGDNYYEAFPNLYTLRGTPPRPALDYVRSLDRILALDPELVLPSHGEPIVGRDRISEKLTRYRDAIQYVHDETVRGMNAGKDVHTLMREIELPKSLALPETYGRISWSVRGIYEGYVGWFDGRASTMYPVSATEIEVDLVELAGGPDPVVARAKSHLEMGKPELALRLVDAALAAEPRHQAGLQLKLDILARLRDRAVNSNEMGWLDHESSIARRQLSPPPSP